MSAIQQRWACIITGVTTPTVTTCTSNTIAALTGTAPNCGGLKKEQWVENLTAQLFATSYYHVVFTIPDEFNALILGNRKELFTLLFQSASATLL